MIMLTVSDAESTFSGKLNQVTANPTKSIHRICTAFSKNSGDFVCNML
jgi:hypothetical protein